MYKFVAIFALAIACASAAADPKPGILAAAPLAVAPGVAPAVVTATSSQSFIRNAVAAPLVAAPGLAAPYLASPYVASPYLASPYLASPYASPIVAL
ncbi:uncharacterized protein LOC108913245 [Anoplophora glabripennis]|uniref:uncharacterized protein LOC108913245 n=1 Tax=Anoplophora glabripennis TaxID=217634 RepID=UPI000C76289C|nr:uncharacterized protein LOC108913245 [Anoplophora glabripennis]